MIKLLLIIILNAFIIKIVVVERLVYCKSYIVKYNEEIQIENADMSNVK